MEKINTFASFEPKKHKKIRAKRTGVENQTSSANIEKIKNEDIEEINDEIDDENIEENIDVKNQDSTDGDTKDNNKSETLSRQELNEKQKKSKQVAEEKLKQILENRTYGCGIRFMSGEAFLQIVNSKNFSDENAELYSLGNYRNHGQHYGSEYIENYNEKVFNGEIKGKTIVDYIKQNLNQWPEVAREQTHFLEATQPLDHNQLFRSRLQYYFKKIKEKTPDAPLNKKLKESIELFWNNIGEKVLKEILSKPDVEERNSQETLTEMRKIIDNPELITQIKYLRLFEKFFTYNLTMFNTPDWEKIHPQLQKDHYEVAAILGGPFKDWNWGYPNRPKEDENWRVVGDYKLNDGGRLLGVIIALRNNELFKEIKDAVSEAEDFSCPVINYNGTVKYPKVLAITAIDNKESR